MQPTRTENRMKRRKSACIYLTTGGCYTRVTCLAWSSISMSSGCHELTCCWNTQTVYSSY